jgi:hypothetical protein
MFLLSSTTEGRTDSHGRLPKCNGVPRFLGSRERVSQTLGKLGCRGENLVMRLFVMSAVLAGFFLPQPAQSAPLEVSTAVAHCRERRGLIQLSDDQMLLCFDSKVFKEQDEAPFRALKQHGLFVVRSIGGSSSTAIRLANILREKEARILVYDYCLSACAFFFLVASFETYVVKKTVVAWHGTGTRVRCTVQGMEVTRNGRVQGRKWFPEGKVPPDLAERCEAARLWDAFFQQRGISDSHLYEPQPLDIRKRFHLNISQGGQGMGIFWMWHPRNYRDYFKIPITYEAYPGSQEEVDQILAHAALRLQVFYDPPR